jgi:predicted secreted Zn-dependent protease
VSRFVTVMVSLRTAADDARLRAVIDAAVETPLEEYDTELLRFDVVEHSPTGPRVSTEDG